MYENIFFLGGYDLEMEKIKEVLLQEGEKFFDKSLGWGAKASEYEIPLKTPCNKVLIELEMDIDILLPYIVIDHHGIYSNRPPSIIQVLDFLGLKPTRHQELVGQYDQGHIVGLRKFCASDKEIKEILAASHIVSGITEEEQAEATDSLEEAELIGDTLVVYCNHSKTAAITDLERFENPEKREDTLIFSKDGEINYFGPGEMVLKLHQKFGGWYSANPENLDAETGTFWGATNLSEEDVLKIFK